MKEISIFNANDSFFHRAEENAAKINANTGCVAHAYPLEDTERLRTEIASSALLANATNVGMGRLEGISLITDQDHAPAPTSSARTSFTPRRRLPS